MALSARTMACVITTRLKVSHDTMNLAAALSASSIGVLSICGVTFGTCGRRDLPEPAPPGSTGPAPRLGRERPLACCAPKAAANLAIAAAADVAPEAMSFKTWTVSRPWSFQTAIDSATRAQLASKFAKRTVHLRQGIKGGRGVEAKLLNDFISHDLPHLDLRGLQALERIGQAHRSPQTCGTPPAPSSESRRGRAS